MAKLEVVFQLDLAHPLMLMDACAQKAMVRFPETGNTVWIDPLGVGPRPDPAVGRRGFDRMILHVEREAAPADRDSVSYSKLEEWGIVHDAARLLWRVLEFVRDEDFVHNRTVAGYPVVPSETPQQNPVVEHAEASVLFDGETLRTTALSGIAAIQISYGVWGRVCERLRAGEAVPPYRSFLMDAFYFATAGDALRGVVMACAAWEIALRAYLATFTAKSEAFARLEERAPLLKHLR